MGGKTILPSRQHILVAVHGHRRFTGWLSSPTMAAEWLASWPTKKWQASKGSLDQPTTQEIAKTHGREGTPLLMFKKDHV